MEERQGAKVKKKNILIVDDSALMRRVESDIINSDERFQVIDVATNGLEAFDYVTRDFKKYDAVVLDINMPKMNGIEFLEALEHQRLKIKVIVVSTVAIAGAAETIRALELGAFDYVTKPGSFVTAMSDNFKQQILQKLAYATGLIVDRITNDFVSPMNPRAILAKGVITRKPHKAVSGNAKRLVAIASSTGGPKALQQVISKLPEQLNAPVVIVQHMSEGFTKSLASRLDELSAVRVMEAQGGERLKKGVVYLARGGSQMRILKKSGEYVLEVSDSEPARNGLRPCADIMLESIAELDFDDIICVVLTGMGGDGTMGIRHLNETRNIYVIAQDEATSTVYGMPKVVYEAGLVDAVKPLEQIADEITKNVGVQ